MGWSRTSHLHGRGGFPLGAQATEGLAGHVEPPCPDQRDEKAPLRRRPVWHARRRGGGPRRPRSRRPHRRPRRHFSNEGTATCDGSTPLALAVFFALTWHNLKPTTTQNLIVRAPKIFCRKTRRKTRETRVPMMQACRVQRVRAAVSSPERTKDGVGNGLRRIG